MPNLAEEKRYPTTKNKSKKRKSMKLKTYNKICITNSLRTLKKDKNNLRKKLIILNCWIRTGKEK
jgi:hypothetical protein